MWYFGDAVVLEFKLLLCGPLSFTSFTMTGRWLLPSPMQITTCLYVAQTAVLFLFIFFYFFLVCIIGACCAVTLVSAPKFSSVNVLGEFRHVNSSLDCRLMVRAKEAVEPMRCGCTLAARLLRHISCHRFVRFHLCCDFDSSSKDCLFSRDW